jgi:hypothetical protein
MKKRNNEPGEDKVIKTTGTNLRNHCCSLVFKNCPKDTLEKLWRPLEETYPEIFGTYDEEQLYLITLKAKPVVLLENASEFISKIKNMQGSSKESNPFGYLEQLINTIIEDNKEDYFFTQSYSIPYCMKKKYCIPGSGTDNLHQDERYVSLVSRNRQTSLTGRALKDFQLCSKNSDKYDETIKEIIEMYKDKIKAVIHIALDIPHDCGGHYGIIIRNNETVYVFDSMQPKTQYAYFFKQIAVDVFGNVKIEDLNISFDSCPQITGGFVSSVKGDEEYNNEVQNMDSQNHFCYYWAIWYFHAFILGTTKEALESVRQSNHPLVIIKKYIWATLHFLYPDLIALKKLFKEAINESMNESMNESINESENAKLIPSKDIDFLVKFFITHFRYVWDDMSSGNFMLYSIIDCDLTEVRSFKHINDCFYYSIKHTPYSYEFDVQEFSSVQKKKTKK